MGDILPKLITEKTNYQPKQVKKLTVYSQYPCLKMYFVAVVSKSTTKRNMSGPVCGPKACGIVANDTLRMDRVSAKVKLNNMINLVHTWPPVCTLI